MTTLLLLDCGHEFTAGQGKCRCGRCNCCLACCKCTQARPLSQARPVQQNEGAGIKAALERYRKWWQGKICKDISMSEFRLVKDINVVGNPSFVYGNGYFVFEDGSKHAIATNSYVPRKYDVEVKPTRRMLGRL